LRQRRWRKKQAKAGASKGITSSARAPSERVTGEPGAVSRAGFAPQDADIAKKILETWDEEASVSRARFEQRLSRMLGANGAFLGPLGPGAWSVTRQDGSTSAGDHS